MDSIKIDTGVVHVPVYVDGSNGNEISFNPNDLILVERIHKLYFAAKAKAIEYEKKAKDETRNPEKDENGMPLEIDIITEPVKEINQWFREQIDIILGEGTSQNIFGDVVYVGEKINVYLHLIAGVMSFVQPVRTKKIEQYTAPTSVKHRKRAKK